MSLNYDTYISQISNLMVIPSSDVNFQTMTPGMIAYSENRLYRELDLLYTQVTDTTLVSSGNRNLTAPSNTGTFIVVDNINILTPASTSATVGTRVQLVPTSREFIDLAYGGSSITGPPEFFAMASNTQVLLAPPPDAAYTAEFIGVQRPTPLSSGNSSSILTQYVPDLFVAASMIFASGYQRDFAAQGDDPAQGVSWEAQYQKLMASAQVEQARAHFRSEGWTSEMPSPIAKRMS